MGKKVLASFSSMLLFLFFTCILLFASLANANFTPLPTLPTPIYIKSDGTVEPPTAPIHKNCDTYKLTGTINNTIVIQRSSIVLDGDGYTITKPSVNTTGLMIPVSWLPGIRVADVSNVKIVNFAFDGCVTGVVVDNSTKITITHNTFRETLTGIAVYRSSYVNIVGNNLFLKEQTFATGITFQPSSGSQHVRIESNLIVGNSKELPNYDMQPEEYGIWGGFENSVMTKNTLTHIKGIALYNIGANNSIAYNNFEENCKGILINGNQNIWFNNTLYGNNFKQNYENAINAFIRNPPVDFWYNGSVGNYWSDYIGQDKNADGVGDKPYLLKLTYEDYKQQKNIALIQGRDNYPSMVPFNIPVLEVVLPQHPISPTSQYSSKDLTNPPQVSGIATNDQWLLSISLVAIAAVAIIVVNVIFVAKKRLEKKRFLTYF